LSAIAARRICWKSFGASSRLLGAAEAVRPLAELTNVDALAAWDAARRPSDIPSLNQGDAQN
jgi:hypothetical protein